jgi:hypothetical protein
MTSFLKTEKQRQLRLIIILFKYDKIISNVDVNFTFKNLIKNFNSHESKDMKRNALLFGISFLLGNQKRISGT